MEKITTKTKHGDTHSLEYRTWRSIKQRCHNPKSTHYSFYGGRGIKVCNRWFYSYENFLSDMGRKPSPIHSIERSNNSKGYSPKNCYWATNLEQSNNTRHNRIIEYNGVKKSVAQWSRELNLHYQTINYRLRNKWPIEKILCPAFTYKSTAV